MRGLSPEQALAGLLHIASSNHSCLQFLRRSVKGGETFPASSVMFRRAQTRTAPCVAPSIGHWYKGRAAIQATRLSGRLRGIGTCAREEIHAREERVFRLDNIKCGSLFREGVI
jgi:hypothetical protein